VLRAFLWNHIERKDVKAEKLARAMPIPIAGTTPRGDSEVFKSSLLALADLCPSLAYAFARYRLRGEKYKKYVRSAAAALLGQPDPSTPQLLTIALADACRECANLVQVSTTELHASITVL
jgi:hypothetical protein